MIFHEAHRAGALAGASSRRPPASILHIPALLTCSRRQSGTVSRGNADGKIDVFMRVPAYASTAILIAALCLPLGYGRVSYGQDGQEQGQGGGQGMAAAFAEHGVQGTVTAISGDDITVKTENGATYKIETGVNTRFRKQGNQSKLADIHVGDMVGAFGDKDDKAKTLGAVAVMVFDKEQYEKARADFGKTWTAGAVQSIDETRITIKRPDNVVQTIVVDENTSFRKHRDSVTLADIKVGDNVSARGALQGANFLATVLSVGGPGAGAGFRGGPRTGGAANGPAPPTGNPPASPNP
jgi:Domain of unknown function (DUF5666)